MKFQVHSPESAPPGARTAIEAIVDTWGFLPNLARVLAESPAALELLLTGYAALSAKSTLTAVEQQLVAVVASRENQCAYCVAAHSTLALRSGMSATILQAARDGARLHDSRLDALRVTTEQIVRRRGWLEEGDKIAFFAAGYQPGQLLEVVGWVAMKLLTNYSNHLAATPIDAQWSSQAWEPPIGAK